MKILHVILTLEAASLLVHAQGNIYFGNGSVTPITIRFLNGSERLATAADGLLIGAFYGPAGSLAGSLVPAPGLATIGLTDGVMVNAPSVFPLPGTEPGEWVSLQVRVWDAALGPGGWSEARQSCAGQYYGETRVGMFAVGPTMGPGTPIWQSWQGVNPERFYPLTVYACPEPSTMAIAVLGGLFLLLRRRK